MTDNWMCGAFEPESLPDREPYRCTLPYDHKHRHQAVIDGEVVAQWSTPGDKIQLVDGLSYDRIARTVLRRPAAVYMGGNAGDGWWIDIRPYEHAEPIRLREGDWFDPAAWIRGDEA